MEGIVHHAIVVTGPAPSAHAAHEKARKIFIGYVKPTAMAPPGAMGGFHSVMIAPDGSKEGWPESDVEDERRSEFIKYLRSQYFADGSSALKWAEVQFGSDELGSEVIASSEIDYQKHLKLKNAKLGDSSIAEACAEKWEAQKPAADGQSERPDFTAMEHGAGMHGWQDRHVASSKPIVRVTWWDASKSSTEYFRKLDTNYKPGVVDDVVGYLVGETDEWLIIADSFQADISVDAGFRDYRSIRNIPKNIVLKVQELVPAERT